MSPVRRASRSIARLSLAGAWIAALSPARARASDSTDQCLASYEAGQRMRQSGELVEAIAELRACGGPACPVRMQRDCQRWLDDVERATPTVVFRVRGDDGELLADVRVSIDGGPVRRLDGRALLMNPGEHVMSFEHAGYQPLKTPVFVTEGEKLEPREVTLESLVELDVRSSLPDGVLTEVRGAEPMGPVSPARDDEPSLSPWPIALGAVALAGGAGFVYFGVRAKNGETDLEQCSPDCRQAQVDDVKRDYLLSNVSLGVGLAGLVGAGLLLVLDEPASRGASTTPRHGVTLGSTTTWVTRF